MNYKEQYLELLNSIQGLKAQAEELGNKENNQSLLFQHLAFMLDELLKEHFGKYPNTTTNPKPTKSYKWRRTYGDGYETDDSVLWIDGKPTENVVSLLSYSCAFGYVEGKQIATCTTKKEAKERVLQELKERGVID